MQQAYISETANKMGNWQIIGYSAPGDQGKTTNFEYTETVTFGAEGTVELSTTDQVGWNAKNNNKLNDCASGINWTVKVKASSTKAGEATFTAGVANKSTCLALTPTFENIGK